MLAALAAAATTLAVAAPAAHGHVETIGHSVEGRAIVARAIGNRGAGRKVLVIGCIHGNECAGIRVTRRLAAAHAPEGSVIWLVHQLNPDGALAGTRVNAHGVDLNRNFPAGWRSGARDATYGGPAPLSEPETRAIRTLIVRLRPDVTIWLHQPQKVVRGWGPSKAAARRYATLARMGYASIRWPPGSASRWQNTRWPRRAAYTVELAPGSLSDRRAARHAAAVLRIARSR